MIKVFGGLKANYHRIRGLIYSNLNKYENALQHYKIALECREKILPSGHSYIVILHNDIVNIYNCLGRYKDALRHYNILLEICKGREETFQPSDPFFAILGKYLYAISYNIGITYVGLGWYEDALQHYNILLKTYIGREKTLKSRHPFFAILHNYYIAMIYNDIGIVYLHLSQYEDALWHFKIVLEVKKRLILLKDLDIVATYNNIGLAYIGLNQYEDALRFIEFALVVIKRAILPRHLDNAKFLCSLGMAYNGLGRYEDALVNLKAALEIAEKSLPSWHSVIFNLLNYTGMAYIGLGQHEDALVNFKLASEIVEKSLPPWHPDIVNLFNYTGIAYIGLGQYEDALVNFKLASEIVEKSLPPWHPAFIGSNNLFILTYYNQGDSKKAVGNIFTLIERLPAIYQNIMTTYSEKSRTSFLRSMNAGLSLLNTIAYTVPGQINAKALYNVLLHTKDIGAEAELVIRASDLPERYPEYAESLLKLKEKQQRRDYLILNDPAQNERIESLSKEIQDIEIELSPYLEEIDFKRHMAKMTGDTVLKKLPQNSALLEYGWFYYYKSAADMRADVKSGGKYYAYLLRDGEITLRYLEADDPVHKPLYEVRRKITNTNKEGNPSPLEIKDKLRELYRLLISPFAENLSDINHLYIAPDGELYKLPFELLTDENNVTLSDKFGISYLSSGRDLARPENWNKPAQGYTNAAIVADPLFDLPDGAGPETADDDAGKLPGIGSRQSHEWDKQVRFDPIPFAKVEAQALVRVFGGKKDIRYELNAKKSTLNEIGSPDIIHIVTHGFALEKQEVTEDWLKMLPLAGQLSHDRAEDPLIRSGLAFSGANTWLKSDKKEPLKEYGDGILNAKEVLSLDLHGTDLLVLSACQTALGETRNGEGIQGLRRAFELAGVRSIICTLWSVADDASAILMGKFYENLFNNNDKGKLQALTDAKDYVKNMTYRQLIHYYRENGFKDKADKLEADCNLPGMLEIRRYEKPYYWAGYILQGDIS